MGDRKRESKTKRAMEEADVSGKQTDNLPDKPVESSASERRILTPREAWELAQAARIRAEEVERQYWAEEARRMNLWEDEDDL